jgi:hypothetical protein
MTAVAVGGATQKDDGTRTSLQSGGDGNCTVKRLVVSPPPPVVGRHHLLEEGCRSEMLSSCGDVDNNEDSANDDGRF